MSVIQARSHLLIPEDLKYAHALIIGAGTVGSNVAMALASVGVRRFTIIDYDTVGIHNLPSQLFTSDQVGYSKATCLAENLVARFEVDGLVAHDIDGKFLSTFPTDTSYQIVVSAADSMVVRKKVSAWSRGMACRVIDTRCAGHEVQTWAYDAADHGQFEAYQSTLYKDSEASPLPCGGEMFPAAGLAAAINTLAAVSSSGFFYRMADTEISSITG